MTIVTRAASKKTTLTRALSEAERHLFKAKLCLASVERTAAANDSGSDIEQPRINDGIKRIRDSATKKVSKIFNKNRRSNGSERALDDAPQFGSADPLMGNQMLATRNPYQPETLPTGVVLETGVEPPAPAPRTRRALNLDEEPVNTGHLQDEPSPQSLFNLLKGRLSEEDQGILREYIAKLERDCHRRFADLWRDIEQQNFRCDFITPSNRVFRLHGKRWNPERR